MPERLWDTCIRRKIFWGYDPGNVNMGMACENQLDEIYPGSTAFFLHAKPFFSREARGFRADGTSSRKGESIKSNAMHSKAELLKIGTKFQFNQVQAGEQIEKDDTST
ncbi:predicted protein [Sclerotinia sclerotiorum 1980 UF-70]|uniref:Uncharacterized protein n=1 Tax=Sclerotinia sclerotiorum (strain ATCC 18683 / 1980 / Ss-1) TaxID=665079 RepID=A7EIV6_SCLS1|nr:predicted protein [Sclerotinia sclerotiorum 1980 UF-70]EDO02772.1 predicted protein [Sclerotinia sclerotiorum 1980 UF-70]